MDKQQHLATVGLNEGLDGGWVNGGCVSAAVTPVTWQSGAKMAYCEPPIAASAGDERATRAPRSSASIAPRHVTTTEKS